MADEKMKNVKNNTLEVEEKVDSLVKTLAMTLLDPEKASPEDYEGFSAMVKTAWSWAGFLVFEKMLRDSGGSGEEALHLIGSFMADAVTTDVGMQVTDLNLH